MRKSEIEAWALREIERSEKPHKREDSFAELKSEWPTNTRRAARQLAGLCNAARGEPALWLIGIKEQHGVTGADPIELSNWWGGVTKHFDGPHPDLTDVNITHERGSVTALCFDTDRAPYVVKCGDEGREVQREVPWREGNSTLSASHNDLLKILVPRVKASHCEFVSLTVYQFDERWPWAIRALLLVDPPPHDRVTVLNHSIDGNIELSGTHANFTVERREIKGFIGPGAAHLPTGGGFFERPGAMEVELRLTSDPPLWSGDQMRVTIKITPVGNASAFSATADLISIEREPGCLRAWASPKIGRM